MPTDRPRGNPFPLESVPSMNPADRPLDPNPAPAHEERAPRQREMASLRAQVNGLRRLVLLATVIAVVAVAFAAYATFRSKLSVQEMRLVGPGGTRAKLEFDDGYPQLVFFDREGVKRAVFDEAGLILWGLDGTTMLREIGDASRLEFKRAFEGRETLTWLVNDGVRQQLLLKDKIDGDEIRLALDGSKGARIQTYDGENGAFSIPAGTAGEPDDNDEEDNESPGNGG